MADAARPLPLDEASLPPGTGDAAMPTVILSRRVPAPLGLDTRP